MQPEEIRIASEEVRANYIKTAVLLCLMAAAIVGLSWLLGELLGDLKMGLTIGAAVCAVVIPLELLCAKFAVIRMTGCKRAKLNDPRQRRIIQLVEGLSVSAVLRKCRMSILWRQIFPTPLLPAGDRILPWLL